MDSLSLYWNVGDTTFAGKDRGAIQAFLKGSIAQTAKDTGYLYCRLFYLTFAIEERVIGLWMVGLNFNWKVLKIRILPLGIIVGRSAQQTNHCPFQL